METTTAQPQSETSGQAIASLVFAILSVVFGPFTAIPAIILAHVARRSISRHDHLRGMGMANAGLIIGYFLLVISVIAFALYFMAAASPPSMPHGP